MTIYEKCAAKARTEACDQAAQWARICLLFNPFAVQQGFPLAGTAYTTALSAYLHACAVEAHLA